MTKKIPPEQETRGRKKKVTPSFLQQNYTRNSRALRMQSNGKNQCTVQMLMWARNERQFKTLQLFYRKEKHVYFIIYNNHGIYT